jgi:hypothetical protein
LVPIFYGKVRIIELTDMPESEIVKKKVRKKRMRRGSKDAESIEEETEVKTASQQARFLEKERQGLNWDPDVVQQVRDKRKERGLPGGKGGIDDLDKQFAGRAKTIKRDVRIERYSGENEMKGPKLDEKKEKEINEEKKGKIPKIPKGKDDTLQPAKFSSEDQSALENEVRKIRKDQPKNE